MSDRRRPGSAPGTHSSKDTAADHAVVEDYEPPTLRRVGEFASDTHGSVSVGNSDDSDAGQYYSP